VIGANEDFFFEDYSILAWSILINILKWFNLLNLFKCKVSPVSNDLNLQLVSLRLSGIRGHTLYDQAVAFTAVGLEDHVFYLHIVVDPLTLSLSDKSLAGLALVHNSQTHVLQQVLICGDVHLNVKDGIVLVNLEIVLGEEVEFALF